MGIEGRSKMTKEQLRRAVDRSSASNLGACSRRPSTTSRSGSRERERMAAAAVERLGVRVIERTDRFTLLGADARRGKLTLFDAEGRRERGALERIGLRVYVARRPRAARRPGRGARRSRSSRRRPTPSSTSTTSRCAPRIPTRRRAAGSGSASRRPGAGRLEVGGAFLELTPGDPGEPERPLLNHLGVLVDSVEEHRVEAEELGVEIDDVVDAPNTLALFVWGPDRVKLEYIEHKPSFSLT